ncbi:MAG: hypothetical protein ACTSSA_10160 [Candidatus Freyarchaeota archaeon]
MPENLLDLIISLNEKEAVELVKKRVEAGEDPSKSSTRSEPPWPGSETNSRRRSSSYPTSSSYAK